MLRLRKKENEKEIKGREIETEEKEDVEKKR